jgi:glycosyltransferase involved in cell wall biosynthesis
MVLLLNTNLQQDVDLKGASGALNHWLQVSVIVPTYNRASYLSSLLNALSAQVYPSSLIEVIIVDNSSTDGTEEVVNNFTARTSFPVRYLYKNDEGPAIARNLGARSSAGEILAFTDSDCIPRPDWIRNAVSGLGEGDGFVCGSIIPVPGERRGFLEHQMERMSRDNGTYPTANILYRRAVFEALGGFREDFGTFSWGFPVGGDDTDLAWRVKRAGYGVSFVPNAVIYHQSSPSSLKDWLLAPMRLQVVPRLMVTIPELRETFLWNRYFLSPITATFYLALVGLVLATLSPWGLLLVLPWFWMIGRETLINNAWPPTRWLKLLLMLVLNLQRSCFMALVLVVSSLRNRRLVL